MVEFLIMNYKEHYNRLNKRARNRVLEGYVEHHHIIPRCLGGKDCANNIVQLTAREHYVAHQLLIRMYPNNAKLIYAARMMTVDRHGGRISNRLYGWLREKFSIIHSETMTGRKLTAEHKKKISESGKGLKRKPFSTEHKQKMSEAAKKRPVPNKGQRGLFGWFTNGQIEQYMKISEAPIGWNRGRHNSKIGAQKRG